MPKLDRATGRDASRLEGFAEDHAVLDKPRHSGLRSAADQHDAFTCRIRRWTWRPPHLVSSVVTLGQIVPPFVVVPIAATDHGHSQQDCPQPSGNTEPSRTGQWRILGHQHRAPGYAGWEPVSDHAAFWALLEYDIEQADGIQALTHLPPHARRTALMSAVKSMLGGSERSASIKHVEDSTTLGQHNTSPGSQMMRRPMGSTVTKLTGK